MSARDLAQRLHAARDALRAAELAGDSPTAEQARAEILQSRKALFAMDATERAVGLFDPSVPMACLPVRIETAFLEGTRLRIRVYPDTAHLGGHDPRITATELALAQDVMARTGAEDEAALHSWMDTLTGAGRGAYIRSVVASGQAQLRGDTDADLPVRAAALPDHWQATLTWGAETLTVDFPAMVAEPLTLGPSPEDVAGLLGPDALARLWRGGKSPQTGLAWMIDFDTALEAGMAVEINLKAQAALGAHVQSGGVIDTVSVTGLRWAGPAEARDTLSTLMTGHAIHRDLQIAPQGSATRNDGERRTPVTLGQRGGPNAVRLGQALGLSEAAMALCGDIRLDEDQIAAHTATALWPGTVGLYAEASLGLDADSVEPLRLFFRDRLRARGHVPVLRVGAEPYGVLPLTLADTGDPVPGTAFEEAVVDRISVLRASMRPQPVSTEPPADYETWLDLFGTEPHPGTLLGLPFGTLDQPASRFASTLLDQLSLPRANEALSNTTAIKTLIEVAPRLPLSRYPADARHRTDRVASEVLRTRSLSDLLALLPQERWPVQPWREMPLVRQLNFDRGQWHVEQDGAQPGDPVVFTLLRHALFCHYAALMRAGIAAAGEAPAALVDPEAGPRRMPLLDQFQDVTGMGPEALTLPLSPDVARQLQLPAALTAQNAELAKVMDALISLDDTDPEALELAVREHMALVSYRPDAWASALDAARLDRMRADTPEGVLIAGYGRVCGLRPGLAPSGQEALLARSPDQAITAAALRQGMKQRAANGEDAAALAVNLSSARVGPAQDVLAALRAGRSLGAVLGQRIEQAARRALASQPDVLNATIDQLRRQFPLREGLRQGAPSAHQTADICDGISAIAAAQDAPLTIPAPARPMVQEAAEVIAAFADLGLAEAVHGLVTASPDRAGAALDALSRGDTPPDTFEVVQDRRSGAGLEMDITVLGAARPVPTSPARSLAEVSGCSAIAAGPVDGIVARWLGPLSRYGFWGQIDDAPAQWVALDGLGLDPMAVLLAARADGTDLLTVQAGARRIDVHTPGPNGQPSYGRACVLFDRLRRMLVEATAIGTDQGARDETDEAARRAYAADTARHVRDTLRRDGAAALPLALAFGRADAATSDLTEQEATAQAARVAEQLDRDVAEFEAGGGYDLLFGPSLPTAPVLGAPAQSELRAQLAQAPDLRAAHGEMTLTHWLYEVGQTRPRVQAMLGAAEACETLRDETVLTLHPHQDGSAAAWAGMAAPSGAPISRAGLIVSDGGAPTGGLVIDSWSEVLPDTHVDAALAIEAASPSARAPQLILLALSPDETPFDETAPLRALDRLFALMTERALAPQEMGDMLHLPPVMSFQEPKP